MKALCCRLAILSLLCASTTAQAEWPTKWSGSLPTPVLMVHGINANMSTWGAYGIGETLVNSITDSCENSLGGFVKTCVKNGPRINPCESVQYIGPGGANDIANKYGLSKQLVYNTQYTSEWITVVNVRTTTYTVNTIEGLNHNGLEFYNSCGDGDLYPWASIEGNQTEWLYDRMERVLFEYYGDSWQTDASKRIKLVAHSQGGIVIRNAIAKYRYEGLGNPLNHIESIVTLNTPHLGTALVTEGSGVGATDAGLQSLIWQYKNGNFNSYTIAGSIKIDPFKDLRELMRTGFPRAQADLSYPYNFKNAAWIPYYSVMRYDSDKANTHSSLISKLKDSGYPRAPRDNRPIPLTALYSTAPGAASRIVSYGAKSAMNYCNGLNLGALITGCLAVVTPITGLTTGAASIAADLMDKSWSLNSDLAVDLSSQKADGLFFPGRDPFIAKPIVGGPYGVPHMTVPNIGLNGSTLNGSTTRGADIIEALENPPVPTPLANGGTHGVFEVTDKADLRRTYFENSILKQQIIPTSGSRAVRGSLVRDPSGNGVIGVTGSGDMFGTWIHDGRIDFAPTGVAKDVVPGSLAIGKPWFGGWFGVNTSGKMVRAYWQNLWLFTTVISPTGDLHRIVPGSLISVMGDEIMGVTSSGLPVITTTTGTGVSYDVIAGVSNIVPGSLTYTTGYGGWGVYGMKNSGAMFRIWKATATSPWAISDVLTPGAKIVPGSLQRMNAGVVGIDTTGKMALAYISHPTDSIRFTSLSKTINVVPGSLTTKGDSSGHIFGVNTAGNLVRSWYTNTEGWNNFAEIAVGDSKLMPKSLVTDYAGMVRGLNMRGQVVTTTLVNGVVKASVVAQ